MLKHGLREQIAERKQELLEFLGKHQAASFVPPPIVKRTAHETAPLSFAQERLWFLEQLEPGNTVYNICRASRLVGQLNLIALEASLNEIVRRHEVLRSAIRVVDGRPAQIIQPPFELKIPVTDLRHLSNSECQEEISCQIQKAAESPFDFSCGKFLRVRLLRLGNDEQVLIITTHHIVSDAWSLGILTRELWSLYQTYAAGNGSLLEELPVQYGDFAVWQRNWLQGEAIERQVAYWKEQLKELTPLSLPADRPRPARQSFAAVRCPITLSESLTIGIKELSNESEVTPFMILLAAFQVLLYRYCGQEDIVVGSAVANRARTELEPLVGFFINMLVLRSDLSGNPTFKDLLARVREVCLGAYGHQDLPFEKLVQELQPERDQSRNPLFQVLFVLQNATRPFTAVPDLRIEPIDRENTYSQFDLSLFLREREGKYIGYIEYSTDLFDRDRIERMIGHLQTLLQAIITDPDQAIATLPILTDVERHQILIEWNDTAADYPKDKCIHQLFEEQAERTPEAIAVEFEEQQITYGELNRRASQLAHYLMGLGVGPEKLVGICVDRSIEMIVGLLGILKAGGAYVPLDPSYPEERLQFMVQDAHVSVLLTQQRLAEERKWLTEVSDLPGSISDPRIRVVCLDRDSPLITQQRNEAPNRTIKPDNLAYVIYTSGSTGQPKGVAIEHRNTCNLLQWAKTVYATEELRAVLASTSICFDLSAFELFVPLSWGGKVVLVETALCLRETSAATDITLVNTVPSVMCAVLSAAPLPVNTRSVNLAGEPLRPELVSQLYDLGTVKKVYDLYGPSETTTYSTFVLRTTGTPRTIGKPISNTQIYILDSQLQPVPVGVHGEIYIGGAGVARGYLNRQQLTSEKFIPNPYANNGTILYRSGDLGRYLPDGRIEFLGRTDNQVKIRGYRIELGEIEAVLNQHPAVKESALVVRDPDSMAEKTITAYVMPRQQSASLSADLHDYLLLKVPHYMMPSEFVTLHSFPLTTTGKIDRNALATAENPGRQLIERFTEPRTELERLVAQIWCDVLKLENVGIHDNFFKLGGHSLLALQIVARLREALDREVPSSALFDTPTVARLADQMEGLLRKGDGPDLPPIVRAPRDRPLPLSMNQEHLWRLDRMIPGTNFFNIPQVYRLTGDLNFTALEKALQKIVARHEALRTNFAEIDGQPVQLINEALDLRLKFLDLRGESANKASQQAASVLLEEREMPFDLETEPLLRTRLIRLTETESLLSVTMHHIISDQWSMQIFRREMASLYEAFAQGRSSPLAEPRIQFADFAYWERQLVRGSLLNDQLSYWKRRIILPLPDCYNIRNRTQTTICHMSLEAVEVDRSLYAAIRHSAETQHCTPFMMLIGALSIALYDCTGNQDVIIATLAANRSKTETAFVIGHLMNTLILRFQVSPKNTIRQHLEETRARTVEAFAHQHLPFEELARVLESEAGVLRQSVCQVLFTYQFRHSQTRQHSGLSFAPFYLATSKPVESIAFTTFNLILPFTATPTELIGAVNYRSENLSVAKVQRLIQVFNKMLLRIVNTPSATLSAALVEV